MKTSGVGLNTFAGANEIRRMQVGFPVKLTSTYDADTGYSWERLVLEPPIGTTPSAPEIGNKAFTIDDNQDLDVDQTGWLEPAQEATGYIFQPATAAGSDPSLISTDVGSEYDITADDTWQDTGIELTTSTSGLYLVCAQASLYGLATNYTQLGARLLIDGSEVNSGSVMCGVTASFFGTVPLSYVSSIDSGKTVKIQAYRKSGVTWTIARLDSSGGAHLGKSFIQLVKLA